MRLFTYKTLTCKCEFLPYNTLHLVSTLIWTLSASACLGPWLSLGHCDPTCGHISNPRVSYERYGYHLSRDTFCFIVGWVVWSQRIVKVQYFLPFFQKSDFFTLRWKQISKCSHLKMNWWKFMKSTANSHKYPKLLNAERCSKKYWAIRELFKFEVLAPCGRHANEVIRPNPLACPCLRIWWISKSYDQYAYI